MNVAKSFLNVWIAPLDESGELVGRKGGKAVKVNGLRGPRKDTQNSVFFKNISKSSN